ncbi:MAG: hypothetical protein ACK574_01070 [Bacteroidota bacterium]|jgi:hypothetical protein
MAFQVGSLSNYTKTNEQMLLVKSFFEPKTASLMSKLTGVKSSIQLPNLDDTLVWQTGGTCGLVNASGDTTIAARVLTIGKVKSEKSWCVADLEAKYTQLLLSPGSQYESLPGGIDEAFMNTVMGNQGQRIEQAIWQGDTTAWQDFLNKFDGLIKIIGAASGVVQANATPFIATPATAITVSNIIAVLQATYNAIPVQILNKPDLRIFMGTDLSRLYQTALINANLFNFVPAADSLGEYYLHGTNVKIVPVDGLNSTNKLYAARTSNLFLGVDGEGEDEELKVWYSEDYDTVYMRMKFKMGVQIGIPTEVVRFTL